MRKHLVNRNDSFLHLEGFWSWSRSSQSFQDSFTLNLTFTCLYVMTPLWMLPNLHRVVGETREERSPWGGFEYCGGHKITSSVMLGWDLQEDVETSATLLLTQQAVEWEEGAPLCSSQWDALSHSHQLCLVESGKTSRLKHQAQWHSGTSSIIQESPGEGEASELPALMGANHCWGREGQKYISCTGADKGLELFVEPQKVASLHLCDWWLAYVCHRNCSIAIFWVLSICIHWNSPTTYWDFTSLKCILFLPVYRYSKWTAIW